VTQQNRSTFVLCHPSEIVAALVGLMDVRVLHYARSGSYVELMIEQVVEAVRCPTCGGAARVKERPVVRYIDLPVFGVPMRLAWKKHRMVCVESGCPKPPSRSGTTGSRPRAAYSPPGRPNGPPNRAGLDHLAFRCALEPWAKRLDRLGVAISHSRLCYG
jgi:hypothetical protein